MKHLLRSVLAATLAISLSGMANARPDHRHEHPAYRAGQHFQPPQHHFRERHHRPSYTKHRHNWIAPAAILTIGGLAIGSAAYASPPPVIQYTAPPPPPPAGTWYYCRSAGQYYPYTHVCPEGWQAVLPR